MHQMTSLEYSSIVRELSAKLAGKHFGRIKKLGEGLYRMKIGTSEIVCELGTRMHETRYISEGGEADRFADKVAKELDNARLLSLEQINNDRILSFVFDRGALIFEMFADGNGVLARDGKILCAVRTESWSDREIRPGSAYQPPSNVPARLIEMSPKYVIVPLMRLPLGKEYALEALARAGIDQKKPANQLTDSELGRLEGEIAAIRGSPEPSVFYDERGKPVDFALTRLSRHSKLKTRNFKTLSEAADEYYQNAERPNPKLEKLLARLEKQEERLEELKGEEKAAKAAGDYIYANYAEAERLISLARGGDFTEIEAKRRGKVDKKERSAELEL